MLKCGRYNDPKIERFCRKKFLSLVDMTLVKEESVGIAPFILYVFVCLNSSRPISNKTNPYSTQWAYLLLMVGSKYSDKILYIVLKL